MNSTHNSALPEDEAGFARTTKFQNISGKKRCISYYRDFISPWPMWYRLSPAITFYLAINFSHGFKLILLQPLFLHFALKTLNDGLIFAQQGLRQEDFVPADKSPRTRRATSSSAGNLGFPQWYHIL